MRAPISVVIPVLNAQSDLARSAAALMEGVDAGLIREMIVSDGGSSDHSKDVAEELGAVWLSGAASRGGQLRRGCAAAQGDWILVLHADTQLEEGWSKAVAAHLHRSEAAYFRLAFNATSLPARFVAGWANLRARLFSLPYGDQALLISRDLYQEIGGFEEIALMEDVAIARALKGRLRALPAHAITSAEKYERAGWLRRGSRNLLVLLRYFAGTPIETLARAYRKP